jgi:transcriptional regulator with XRE-family HTH domain
MTTDSPPNNQEHAGARVSAALRAFRRRHDLTCSEMAQLLNVNRTTLSNWERASFPTHHGRTLSFFPILETLEENPVAKERLLLLLLRSSRAIQPDPSLQTMLPRALQIFHLTQTPRRFVARLHAFLQQHTRKYRPNLLADNPKDAPSPPPEP